MARKFSIFRVSLAGDTKSTIDRLDFNDPAYGKDSKSEAAYLRSVRIFSPHSIGDQQGAEQEFSDQESLGPIEQVIEIKGFISDSDGASDDGQNQFLILLDLWDSEPDIVEGVWDEGRFGIEDNNDHTNDLIPVRTGTDRIGLLWESYEKNQILAKNQTDITIRLRVNKGDGT